MIGLAILNDSRRYSPALYENIGISRTGTQLLARNMRLVRTQSQRDAILALGGQECKTPADFSKSQYAYIPISIWSAPGEDELGLPLAGDLLSQQVQVTCQIRSANQFWTPTLTGGSAPAAVALPSAFQQAYFRVEQLTMNDRGMSMANHADMNTHQYCMPLPTFDQQAVQINIPANPGNPTSQQVLTGFRAGEVKKLQIFLTDNDDPANSLLFIQPTAVTVLYAGVIYSQYENGEGALWNLLDGTSPSAANQSKLKVADASAGWVSEGALSSWLELNFGSPTGSDYEAGVYTHGKEITNGIVNLQVTVPDPTKNYTLTVVYVYNAVLCFSRGSCDLVF